MLLQRFRALKAAFFLIPLLLLCACKTELMTGLVEDDANIMLALLLQHGVSADKIQQKDGSDTLRVEQGQFAQAVALLHEAGYPRQSFQSMGDVFQASGLVSSPQQERARFLWALGQELSRTISDIDGVLTARVQVVLPNNDLLNREPTPSSASVFVRYREQSAAQHLVPQIKQLVADSVEGLSYDRVSVVMVPVAEKDVPVLPTSPGSPLLWEILGVLPALVIVLGAGILVNRRWPDLFDRLRLRGR
ncbi:type III secretion inner membrane ring lipoprotein SctJ [Acetobacter farinalis]|uniref:Lipoprotein n=1 Tax=Acetobacter farinalis TaxID=1260984 RepID=A0ABT3Q7A0_9PROT|nr:type III secretion inner membrane ring lipoprotein SctJ [Acetobacter farinalis]MCX2561150.1 type III secretion inner membrane ring lipoprotein SctJ [Acetobacter farinalis]NHO29879.1 EscJ/YscJ/HrcJ family type III secretion inner membrane ring protein [Acetobacter farinalis]